MMGGLKDWQLKFLRKWVDKRLSLYIDAIDPDANVRLWYIAKSDAFQEIQDLLDALEEGNKEDE